MCLILFAYKTHPDYPLVLAANRDEFFDRPTKPAEFWEDAPQILAGRDLRGGGTWLGVTTGGRLAAVTNYRDRSEFGPPMRSRGLLTREFLGDSRPFHCYLEALSEEAQRYRGFNLLVADSKGLGYLSNRQGRPRRLDPGLYGLSNHLLDTPWPKVTGGKKALAEALQNGGEPQVDALMAVLADTRRPADVDLPDTGFGLDWERILGSRFILSDNYGTRASTVLLVHRSGQVRFVERRFGLGQTLLGETDHSYTISGPGAGFAPQ